MHGQAGHLVSKKQLPGTSSSVPVQTVLWKTVSLTILLGKNAVEGVIRQIVRLLDAAGIAQENLS